MYKMSTCVFINFESSPLNPPSSLHSNSLDFFPVPHVDESWVELHKLVELLLSTINAFHLHLTIRTRAKTNFKTLIQILSLNSHTRLTPARMLRISSLTIRIYYLLFKTSNNFEIKRKLSNVKNQGEFLEFLVGWYHRLVCFSIATQEQAQKQAQAQVPCI